MAREQVHCSSMKQSMYERNRRQIQQSCLYYSFVDIDQTKSPYVKSFERQQTWTFAQTMSNQHKRYQSSIENIHLTMPSTKRLSLSNQGNNNDDHYHHTKTKLERSMSLLPPLPPPRQSLTSIQHRPTGESIVIPVQKASYENKFVHPRFPSTLSDAMKILYVNGEFVVRI